MDGFSSILKTPLPPINLFQGGDTVNSSDATTVPPVLPDRRSFSDAEFNPYDFLAQQIKHLTAEISFLKKQDDKRSPDEINLDLNRTHLCDLNTDDPDFSFPHELFLTDLQREAYRCHQLIPGVSRVQFDPSGAWIFPTIVASIVLPLTVSEKCDAP